MQLVDVDSQCRLNEKTGREKYTRKKYTRLFYIILLLGYPAYSVKKC